MNDIADIKPLIDRDISRMIRKILTDEFQAQGHHLKGGWEKSVELTTSKVDGGYSVAVRAADYTKFVNYRMDKSKASMKMIPFLLEYVKIRWKLTTEEDQVTGAAKIIRSWMKQGRPTYNSFSFSKTGQRINFVEVAIEKTKDAILPYLDEGLRQIVDELITKEIQDFNYR